MIEESRGPGEVYVYEKLSLADYWRDICQSNMNVSQVWLYAFYQT